MRHGQVGDLDTYSECLPAGSAVDCQAGLTLSHMAAWQALATSGELAAWVFECALLQSPRSCDDANHR